MKLSPFIFDLVTVNFWWENIWDYDDPEIYFGFKPPFDCDNTSEEEVDNFVKSWITEHGFKITKRIVLGADPEGETYTDRAEFQLDGKQYAVEYLCSEYWDSYPGDDACITL